MALTRISSYDTGYTVGGLSTFPTALDTWDTLYHTTNNCEAVLTNSLTPNSLVVTVDNADNFPERGILKIGSQKITDNTGQDFPFKKDFSIPKNTFFNDEFIYYYRKQGNVFDGLVRGYCGTRIGYWDVNTPVTSGVFAEHHNALKDAIYNIEHYLGPKSNSASNDNIAGKIVKLEQKISSPRPSFRAFPLTGAPPFAVRFQNFSMGEGNKYFWDFGDGTTSIEKNPIHVYLYEGNFTVELNVVNQTGGQGVSKRTSYVKVSNDYKLPFFYVTPTVGYSRKTAESLNIDPTTFSFVDQTDGLVTSRFWVFGDGETETQTNANIHYTTHIYEDPNDSGYSPGLFDTFNNNAVKRMFLSKDTASISSVKVL